jgi:hypothetical protein
MLHDTVGRKTPSDQQQHGQATTGTAATPIDVPLAEVLVYDSCSRPTAKVVCQAHPTHERQAALTHARFTHSYHVPETPVCRS